MCGENNCLLRENIFLKGDEVLKNVKKKNSDWPKLGTILLKKL